MTDAMPILAPVNLKAVSPKLQRGKTQDARTGDFDREVARHGQPAQDDAKTGEVDSNEVKTKSAELTVEDAKGAGEEPTPLPLLDVLLSQILIQPPDAGAKPSAPDSRGAAAPEELPETREHLAASTMSLAIGGESTGPVVKPSVQAPPDTLGHLLSQALTSKDGSNAEVSRENTQPALEPEGNPASQSRAGSMKQPGETVSAPQAPPTSTGETEDLTAPEAVPAIVSASGQSQTEGHSSGESRADSGDSSQRDPVTRTPETPQHLPPAAVPSAPASPAAMQSSAAPAEQIIDHILAPAKVLIDETPPAKSAVKRIQFELRPESLGPVHVTLRLAAGKMEIEITPRERETKALLAADSQLVEQVVRAVTGAGDISSVTVNITDRETDNGASGNWSAASGGQSQQSQEGPGAGSGGSAGSGGTSSSRKDEGKTYERNIAERADNGPAPPLSGSGVRVV